MGPKSTTPAALGTHSARAGATKSTRSKRADTAGPGAAEVGLGQLVGTAPSGTSTAAVAERTLRLFDLDTRFGPTACISRRARWERADGLGLDPPREVLSLLAVPGVSQEGLWHKRL